MNEGKNSRVYSSVCRAGVIGEMYNYMREPDNEKGILLRRILFEEDASDRKKMKDLIYEFGSMLGVKDVLERKIFVILATMF